MNQTRIPTTMAAATSRRESQSVRSRIAGPVLTNVRIAHCCRRPPMRRMAIPEKRTLSVFGADQGIYPPNKSLRSASDRNKSFRPARPEPGPRQHQGQARPCSGRARKGFRDRRSIIGLPRSAVSADRRTSLNKAWARPKNGRQEEGQDGGLPAQERPDHRHQGHVAEAHRLAP